ncbi:hypothetical protein C8Q73DRAFT_762752 [Cubamyces lactineus]|nr:hypothetical protein C8Q73DRAFT_762752 [Cubamyces lactineus]
MSTRHSFLSTTGLIRPSSVAYIAEDDFPSQHAPPRGTKRGRRTHKMKIADDLPVHRARAGIVPLGPAFIIGLAVLLSFLFILSLSCAFLADEGAQPAFSTLLDDVAANMPGIVLIGDDVDVDVDEPALTIRWSIIACGQAFILPGSEGAHGSAVCGLPAMPFSIFVDGGRDPAATYDPTFFPYLNGSSQRVSIQNMFQFDDDHVLDVHEARLYPFDTYLLTSTLRATTLLDNQSLPIQRLSTLSVTSSFVIDSSDAPTFIEGAQGMQTTSRDLTLRVRRPAEARMYALLLFGASWMLAHTAVALVAFSWTLQGADNVMKHAAFAFLVVLLIPQLRNTMPDAPGFDGQYSQKMGMYDAHCGRVDVIGFFPQMLTSAVSVLMLIAMSVKRELQVLDRSPMIEERVKEVPAPLSTGLMKMRRGGASIDIGHMRNLSRTFS